MIDPSKTAETKIKFKTSMRGLDIFQTVYALLVALGLREVFVAFTTIFEQQNLVEMLIFGNILLLSVRFFWVPRNFRRLYYVSEYCRHHGLGHLTVTPAEASLNLIVILLHALLYFLLCKQFEYFVFVTASYDSLSTSAFASYVYFHASLLILNGIWLIYINAKEDAIRAGAGNPPLLRTNSESRLWYRSNLAFALIAVAPVVVFLPCPQSTFSECVAASYSTSHALSVIPTSAYGIASVFDIMVEAFGGGADRILFVEMWVIVFFALNSILDLALTAGYYVMLEDIEDEKSYSAN